MQMPKMQLNEAAADAPTETEKAQGAQLPAVALLLAEALLAGGALLAEALMLVVVLPLAEAQVDGGRLPVLPWRRSERRTTVSMRRRQVQPES